MSDKMGLLDSIKPNEPKADLKDYFVLVYGE